MSSIKLQATPTGTGVVTLTAPTTNVDRTVTMPDQTGTIYISGGDIGTPSAGNASNLTNLNASNLSTGTVPDARFPATLPAASGANLTALNASNLGSGIVPDARFPATLPAASGANLTNLNASNLSTGTVATARLGTGTANSTTFLRGDQTWATAGYTPAYGAVGSPFIGISVAHLAVTTYGAGTTTAGSNLRVMPSGYPISSSASATNTFPNPSLSGTWVACMSWIGTDAYNMRASTLWMRIS